MENPVLVEVLRGAVVESRHRGAVAVFDGDGSPVLTIGDVERRVFPRSAVKAIQALPLVESGAADAFGFDQADLALACASHSGEPRHSDRVTSILKRAGLTPEALECGVHWPTNQDAMIALARSGAEPGAVHNNCSGKHAGFLCTCIHRGIDPAGYVGRAHPAQQWVREAMEAVTGAPHGDDVCGIDGCSIPTYAVPLKSLANGFARMATGSGLGRGRAAAASRIIEACMAQPFYTSGTGRADVKLMEAGGGRVFTKTGAEGVFCAALPEAGLGIAIKCDDGAGRAADVMVAAVLAGLMRREPEMSARLDELARPVLTNWNGIEVGRLRPTEALTVQAV